MGGRCSRPPCPTIAVDNFYGPGTYADQRDKYLLQAESGTPDVIEGLLEDTAAYVEKGIIEPLDERFAAWEDSDDVRGEYAGPFAH